MLPRRHFSTASSKTTDDIIRTRDAFNTKVIDNNDVAGAAVVKEVLDTQVSLGLRTAEAETDIDSIELRVAALEAGISEPIGTYTEFETEFNLHK